MILIFSGSFFFFPIFQNIVQDVLDLSTLTAYISYARKHIHPKLSDEAAEELTRGYVEMRRRGNSPGSSKKVPNNYPFRLWENFYADFQLKYQNDSLRTINAVTVFSVYVSIKEVLSMIPAPCWYCR